MAYEPTTWSNREVERPRTYVMTQNTDGTVTLTPSEGTVFNAGTPIDASNMNKIEQAIDAVDSALDSKLDLTGGTLTGALTGTVIDGATLKQGGTDLNSLFQPKGNYAAPANYLVWEADPNGVRCNMGKLGGTGKPIYLYLTSGQPAASSTEIRVWIQIDKF